MVQIENEYNYGSVPDSQKVQYIKSLYNDAIRNGIDVPIITCWTQQVRDKTDSVFSQIMDAGNFYPGWNFQVTLPRLNLLKQQQPYSPPFITELQGGWFTAIGDKEVRLVDKYSAGQINGLTKFMIAHGIKGFNYYMLYGGTNFEYWAGKGKTTSYDYTAPISECGGLWEKYYSVKLIGKFIKYAQPYLSRCQEITGGATSSNSEIETILRSDGRVGFVFIWNRTDKQQSVDVSVKMRGQAPSSISLSIGARDVYLLPVDLPIPGGNLIHQSNVQISDITDFNGKPLIIAYGASGEKAIIHLGSRIFTDSISSQDRLYDLGECYVLLTSDARAGRGIVFDTRKGPAVLLSDSYFAVADTKGKHSNLVKLQTKPGNDEFTLIATGSVKHIRLDGKPVNHTKGQEDKLIRFALHTPSLSVPTIVLGQIHYKMDDDAQKHSYFKVVPNAKDSAFPSLDSLGNHQNGFSVYRGKFELNGVHTLKVDYYSDDWHSVFIDGKPVAGLTGDAFEDYAEVKLTNRVHSIDILYENEGRPNSGFMEEKKGLKSIRVLSSEQIHMLGKWKYSIQRTSPPNPNPTEADSAYDDSGWMDISIGNRARDSVNSEQIGSWYRKEVALTEAEVRDDPRLIFEGMSRSASIYVNGKMIYTFRHHGWDAPFTVPIGGTAKAGKNIVVIYVENREGKGGFIRPIKFESGNEETLEVTQLTFHASLNGELAGWQKPDYEDTGWKTIQKSDGSDSDFRIKWYRTSFTLPPHKGCIVPWRIHVESTGDLQIWLNGRVIGRYYGIGPQKDFYMPDGWLLHKKRNSLVLVMHPSGAGDVAPVLSEVTVTPYSEYVAQKHELEFDQ
jgi:hypothetical protein